MTTIALPYAGAFLASKWEFGYSANVFGSESPLNGSVQAVGIPGDRFTARLTLRATTHTERADVEGFLFSLRPSKTVSVNQLSCHHLARPAPRGTMRGSPTVQSDAGQLATSLLIQSSVGATLFRGDMIGVNGQVVMVTADATANGSGVITASITAPLRSAAVIGNSVTWDKPTIKWRVVGMPMVTYDPGQTSDAIALDLVEDFS